MLNIHPESDISLNAIVLGTDVVSFLKKKRGYIFVDACIKDFLMTDQRRTAEHFIDALTLLYALGSIEISGHRIRII